MSICFSNDILWSIKHLRSKLEYTQIGLRTYISVLKLILDWNSHAPGPGEETGLGSLSVPGAVAVCSVRSSQGFTVSVSDSFSLFRLNSCLYVSQMINYGH